MLRITLLLAFLCFCAQTKQTPTSKYDKIVNSVFRYLLVPTIVDPSITTLAQRQVCVDGISQYLSSDITIDVFGVGQFDGVDLAAEYFCSPTVNVVGNPAPVSFSDYSSTLDGDDDYLLWFYVVFAFAARTPLHQWNDEDPDPYAVAPLSKSDLFDFQVTGKVKFSRNKIKTANIFIGDLLGFYAFTENHYPNQDTLFPVTNFCAQVIAACDAIGHSAGYGQSGEDCATALQENPGWFVLGSPEFESDTFGCRQAHLWMAFLNPQIHCPHAAVKSTICLADNLLLQP